MFSNFLYKDFDKVLDIAKNSEYVNDCDFNDDIKEILNKYTQKHKLCINTYIKDKEYIIFGAYIYKHANDISNIIGDKYKYTHLYTNVKNYNFTLNVNNSSLISFYDINNYIYKNIKIINTGSSYSLPPEIELIEIYYRLYSPQHNDMFDYYKEIESKLFEKLLNRQNLILGGSRSRKKKLSINIKPWLLKQNKYILIGKNAYNAMSDNKIMGKIELITDDIKAMSNSFKLYIKKNYKKDVIIKENSIFVLMDNRIKKLSISITIPFNNKKNKCIYLLELYNSAKYDIIPYFIKNGINIAIPYVINRFLLINISFINILYNSGIINQNNRRTELLQIFDIIKYMNNFNYEYIDEVLYLGYYHNIIRYNQKNNQKNNQMIPVYIPQQYKQKNGKYRSSNQ